MEPKRLWPVGASRLIIDTGGFSGEATSTRAATPADADRLVSMFNDTHSRAEMFVPFTPESLGARLDRQPAAHSWSNIWVTDRAALGIWSPRLGVRRESAGLVTEDARALVLDYGFEPGHEAELVALIRSSCGRLAQAGVTELSVFSSVPSPGFADLSALAKRIEPYFVACWVAPGPDLAERGVYVDQLFF